MINKEPKELSLCREKQELLSAFGFKRYLHKPIFYKSFGFSIEIPLEALQTKSILQLKLIVLKKIRAGVNRLTKKTDEYFMEDL